LKCARCFAPEDIRIVDSPDPRPEDDEVLVAVRAVSICPSDHHIYRDGHSSGVVPDHPMILGHEFSGVVAALGARASGPAVGTRVAVEPAWHCGECDLCKRGLTNICRHVVFPSYPNRDGALAEYIACPAHAVYTIPENVGFVEAALAEPLGVAVHAVRHARIGPGDRVAILGAGTIGIAILELAKLSNVDATFIVEPNAARHELALKLGATKAYADVEDLIEEFGGTADCANVAFDVSNAQDSFADAVEVCEPAGRIIVITIPPEDYCEFTASSARRKELAIQFSRRSRNAIEEALSLISTGKVRAPEWPRAEFSLDTTADAFRCSVDPPGGVLRAVVLVNA